VNQLASRVLSDYGVLVPLAILCTFFSLATLNEQFPTGEAAARQVAASIDGSARVVIIVRDHPEDIEFAENLRAAMPDSNVFAIVKGEPKDAREALRRLKQTINVIACTQQTAGWHSLADPANDYPALGNPRIVQPTPYLWPDFLKPTNLRNIASQIAIIAIVAIGMTLVIITGGIDLSVGSLIALSSVVAAMLMRDVAGGRDAGTFGMIAACVSAILVCAGLGLFTGSVIRAFDVPPFIVTLAMLLVGSGLAGMLSQDQSINDVPASFAWLGRGADLFNIPNAVVLMIMLYIAAHILMARTALGRYIYAVGGNREAARLSGVPVGQILLLVYTLSGALAGVGGIMMASQFTSGSHNFGQSYELYAITAVVVGGTSLSGGEGTIVGTLIGAFTTAVIANGMNLLNVPSRPQMIVLGLVILGAVIFDSVRRRRAA
jgi:ribose transport system permease protein